MTDLHLKYKTLFQKAGITSALRLAHFFGQLEHESNLKPKSENLRYSKNRLMQIFKRDLDINRDGKLSNLEIAFAESIAYKPVQIANFVYANQNGNGGVSSGDGWKYRGRGFIQTTGKTNYIKLSKATGIDFVNNPDLLLEEPNAMIAALFYWTSNNLNRYADLNDVEKVTRRINGGVNGLADRIVKTNQYLKYFKNNGYD